jgi:hypothetical protein
MSADSGTTRWWENYLVRYLMPSIAGVAIVGWLCTHAGAGFRSLLFLPPAGERLDAPSLTLLFLYGNLFCYVASYPVLVYHVTRCKDFRNGNWPALPYLDGYITTILFTGIAFLSCLIPSPETRFRCAFALSAVIVLIQLWRESLILFPRIELHGIHGKVSPAFAYAFALARTRGTPELIETVKSPTAPISTVATVTFAEPIEDQVTTVRRVFWRSDFMETYRHMREHGNSAFMFVAELELAALVYCIVAKPGQVPVQQLGNVGTLLALWTVPAMFVHLVGQHLERRFSRFDRRLQETPQTSEAVEITESLD